MEPDFWEEVSFVQRSANRERILRVLVESGRPMTPTELGEETGVVVKTASRAVRSMTDHGLVECVNPGAPRDRRYRPTSDGREVVARLEELEQRDSRAEESLAFGETVLDYGVDGVPGELEDDLGSLRLSKNRKAVMHALAMSDVPLTPSELAEDLSLAFNSVSRALQQLSERGLVRCVTPRAEKYRRYALTERGERVFRVLTR